MQTLDSLGVHRPPVVRIKVLKSYSEVAFVSALSVWSEAIKQRLRD